MKLRDLLPYLRPHRRTLVVVGALAALGSALARASPLLTREVLNGVREQRPTGTAVLLLLLSVVGGQCCRRDHARPLRPISGRRGRRRQAGSPSSAGG